MGSSGEWLGEGYSDTAEARVTSIKTIAFITELHTSDTREGRIMIAGIRGGTSLGLGQEAIIV